MCVCIFLTAKLESFCQKFDPKGGLVLVSHDMRLIGQVANEIWICDNKTITPYKGDIQNFKMDMRAQMGIGQSENTTTNKKPALRGDASVKQSADDKKKEMNKKEKVVKAETKLEVIAPTTKNNTAPAIASKAEVDRLIASAVEVSMSSTTTMNPSTQRSNDTNGSTTVPTLSANTTMAPSVLSNTAPVPGRYIPPHLRKKMLEEQQRQQQQSA
jgi:ATPase subunit of ABC transporter with duplicated ATPase domains